MQKILAGYSFFFKYFTHFDLTLWILVKEIQPVFITGSNITRIFHFSLYREEASLPTSIPECPDSEIKKPSRATTSVVSMATGVLLLSFTLQFIIMGKQILFEYFV